MKIKSSDKSTNTNSGIRRISIFAVLLFLAMIGQATYLHTIKAKELKNNPNNVRELIRQFSLPRGTIFSADGVVLAKDVPSDDVFKYSREYPARSLFSQIVGWHTFDRGNSGLEAAYNKDLTDLPFSIFQLDKSLSKKENFGNLTLSVRHDYQEKAAQLLGDRRGSIVVMKPNGEIAAMYSSPSYDPSDLTSHNKQVSDKAWQELNADPNTPLIPSSYAKRFPPGSTFKIVTAAVGLETGFLDDETKFPIKRSLVLPQSDKSIKNFGGSSCGGSLESSFIKSCNTAFAQAGLSLEDSFEKGIQNFGIENNTNAPPLDVAQPGASSASSLEEGSFSVTKPEFAYAGIGQGRVYLSPLQVALFTATIANNGDVPTPHLVTRVENSSGQLVKRISDAPWIKNAVSPEVAKKVAGYMADVVEKGTGTKAKIAGLNIAGKTGTAEEDCGQENLDNCRPHAWFTSFYPVENPEYIVTVLIERGSTSSDATGGSLAAPLAKQMIQFLESNP